MEYHRRVVNAALDDLFGEVGAIDMDDTQAIY